MTVFLLNYEKSIGYIICKTVNAVVTKIPRSIKMLRAKAGMVILVGKAARLVISDMAMAKMANINNTKLLPAITTANTVSGVITQP